LAQALGSIIVIEPKDDMPIVHIASCLASGLPRIAFHGLNGVEGDAAMDEAMTEHLEHETDLPRLDLPWSSLDKLPADQGAYGINYDGEGSVPYTSSPNHERDQSEPNGRWNDGNEIEEIHYGQNVKRDDNRGNRKLEQDLG
jgi:hypothetical protein